MFTLRLTETVMSNSAPLSFRIEGMDCAEEVSVLNRAVGPLVGGVENLAFDVLNARMTVQRPPDGVTADSVVAAVARTGMTARPWTDTPSSDDATAWKRHGRTLLTAASGLLGVIGYAVHAAMLGDWTTPFAEADARSVPLAAKVVYAAGILAGAWLVLPKAWASLRSLRPDMNLLMVAAVVGATWLGDWLEAVTVAFLFALSLALEAWSVGRARRAVAALLDLAPVQVRVVGGDKLVPVAEVPVGTRFVVRPGEKIPLDGTVAAGGSEVNQAPITGESVPVLKEAGVAVYAGTMNGDGALEVVSTRATGDTTLACIIRLVRDAQAKRSPAEQWVERFARVYTPAVMLAALLVLLAPPLLFAQPWAVWVYRALVLLVIACPCALVISTPVSVVAALAAAARNGVLVKGGAFVEIPARLRAVALDKTGTLTAGTPVVVELVPLNGHTEEELLDRAAALEGNSAHPLARAITAAATARGRTPAPATDLQTVQGKGLTGSVGGREFWLGSHRYLEERGQETPDVHAKLEAFTTAGRTVVAVGNAEHVCGLIALADTIRPEAVAAVGELKRLGVERVVMLTGDNRGTAEAVGTAAGVDEVRAELLPEQKVAEVERLVREYGSVAMVGDGINDAPALGRATMGVAMGAAGTDAAIETADVALMSDDLRKLPWLIRHARRTLRVIRQNITVSLATKAGFVLLTLAGVSSMWAAVAADTGVSLLVVANALRLLRGRG